MRQLHEIGQGRLVQVRIKSTGTIITVYRHHKEGWVNADDCQTIYRETDLEAIKFDEP